MAGADKRTIPYPTNVCLVFVFLMNDMTAVLLFAKKSRHEKGEPINQKKTLLTRNEATDDDLMYLIKHTVQSALEDSVQDTVDAELLLMMRGDGFKGRINDLIDARLHALAEDITVKLSGAEPGRGHTGRMGKRSPGFEAKSASYDRRVTRRKIPDVPQLVYELFAQVPYHQRRKQLPIEDYIPFRFEIPELQLVRESPESGLIQILQSVRREDLDIRELLHAVEEFVRKTEFPGVLCPISA